MAMNYVFLTISLLVLKESYCCVTDPPEGTEDKNSTSSMQNVTEGVKNAVDDSNEKTGKDEESNFDEANGIIGSLDEVVGKPATLKEITFSLTTENNIDNPRKIDFYNPDEVATKNGKILFLIHGYLEDSNTSIYFRDLSRIFPRKFPGSHVIQVDWKKPASDNYAFSAFQTETVGNYTGILVSRLVNDFKVPIENFVLIGHSLGGQVSGWAGKKFKELNGRKLSRIVALDPAGPLFFLRPDTRRLNKDDAEVVMVIHTDGGKLGFPSRCGTIDFFPNGGSDQPGCQKIDLAKVFTYSNPVICDHSRSWKLFLEAENVTGSFMSRKCETYEGFKKNEKCENVEVAMGDLETKETGSFFLETNSEEPFSKPLEKSTNNNNEKDDENCDN